MTNGVNVSGGSSRTNRVTVRSSSTTGGANVYSNMGEYYAELARQYAEQAQQAAEEASQDVNSIVDGMQGTNNVILYKNGHNVTISSKYYVHNQPISSNVWNIQHNLNKPCPKVTLVDTAGAIFYPPVKFIDNNNCQVNLIGAMAGKAYCE